MIYLILREMITSFYYFHEIQSKREKIGTPSYDKDIYLFTNICAVPLQAFLACYSDNE